LRRYASAFKNALELRLAARAPSGTHTVILRSIVDVAVAQ